ncbi:MAG: hypothetical protein CMO12_00250 [Thaumarchaeota archaeon]|nr:hypothetical protein [Nitrososphaerota archaeon]
MAIIIEGAKLIDGTGQIIEDASIAIKGNRISVVQSGHSIPHTDDDFLIEASGRIVMPGLIDLHVHPSGLDVKASSAYLALRFARNVKAMLDGGVTTVRICGTPDLIDFEVRKAAYAGLVESPRMFTCGKGLCITGGHLASLGIGIEVDSTDSYRKAARTLIKNGVDFIKLSSDSLTKYARPTVEEMKAAINEAHLANKTVATHAGSPQAIMDAIEAGTDTIEHGFLIAEEPDQVLDVMVKKNIYYVPTLYVRRWNVRKDNRYSDEILQQVKHGLEEHPKSFRLAVDAGVKIAMGSDEGGIQGSPYGENAYELELMVANGMSENDAIIASTKTAAEALRMGGILGSIEEGKLADLLVLDADPLKDIRSLQSRELLHAVIRNGSIASGTVLSENS